MFGIQSKITSRVKKQENPACNGDKSICWKQSRTNTDLRISRQDIKTSYNNYSLCSKVKDKDERLKKKKETN